METMDNETTNIRVGLSQYKSNNALIKTVNRLSFIDRPP